MGVQLKDGLGPPSLHVDSGLQRPMQFYRAMNPSIELTTLVEDLVEQLRLGAKT